MCIRDSLRYIDLDENLLTRGSDGTYYRLRIGQDDWIDSVSYTHLDVYKRQELGHILCIFGQMKIIH